MRTPFISYQWITYPTWRWVHVKDVGGMEIIHLGKLMIMFGFRGFP